MKQQAPYREIRVKLPTFIIMALRHLAKDAGIVDRSRWTVSQLLEAWLLQLITHEEMRSVAEKSPEFMDAAEAWLQLVVKEGRQR